MSRYINKYKNLSAPAKASIWFMLCNVIQKGIATLTTPIFTRIMGKEEYGVLSLYNSWLSIITIFATLELAYGVFNKAMIKFENDRDGYTSSTLVFSSCTTIILFIVYMSFNNVFEDFTGLGTPLMIMLFVEIFFTNAMSFWTIRQRFEFRYKSLVAITIGTNIIATLLSVILVVTHDIHQVEYRVAGMVIVHAIVYSVVYLKLIHTGRVLYKREYWNYAFRYNLPLIPHYLSMQIFNQSDRIMINSFCGKGAAGMYSVAHQVAFAMNIVTSAVNASFSPWAFQKIKQGEHEKIGNMSLSILICTSAVCMLFSMFAPEMIWLMGGKEYSSAIWVVPPVVMSIIFNMLYNLVSNYAFYFEKTKFVMIGTVIVAIVNVILNIIFIQMFGFVAAGYTTLFCYIIYSAIHYCFMMRICKKNNIVTPFNTIKMWGVAFGALTITLMLSSLYNSFIARYIIIMCVLLLIMLNKKKIVRIFRNIV